MSATPDPRELLGPSDDRLRDFSTEQWWFAELDQMTQNGTDDQKRAFAVVRNLMATIRVVLDGVPPVGDSSQDPSGSSSNRIPQLIERNRELTAENARLKGENLKLEHLCDATYVASGADAYNHACDEMKRWQKKRLDAGKEVGTTNSLCDGIAWLYGYIDELESRRVTLSPIDLDKVTCRCQTPGNVVGAECPVCSNSRKSIAYTLSRNLIVVRRARGFNLRDLAKQVGTSYVTISRFERGLIPAGILVLARLSTALGVNLSDLLGLPTGLQSDLTVEQLNKTIDSLTEEVRQIREVVADQAVKIHMQAAKAQSVEKDLRVFAWLVSSRARLAPSGAPDLYRVHWVDQDGQHRSTVSSYANPMDAVLEAFERATQ